MLYVEDYDDRLVHFTHSLREVIDLLTRKKQPDEERIKPLPKELRIQSLASVIDPAGGRTNEFNSRYEQLCEEYNKLSKWAHHRRELDQTMAEKSLITVEQILSHLTTPQIEILDKIDEIIFSEPSIDNAQKLKERTLSRSSYLYLVDKLSCEWLKFLYVANAFETPQSTSTKIVESDLPMYWLSLYLIKCVDSMPNLVTEVILKYKFKDLNTELVICKNFLTCSLSLSENNMEKIAQKAINEEWYNYANDYVTAKKYADLAECLYLKGKYNIALDMISCFLNSKHTEYIQSYRNDAIEQILNEKIPRFAKKNPLDIARLLASVLEDTLKQDAESGSDDSSCTLLSSIENHEQNNYYLHDIRASYMMCLRDCLTSLGCNNPAALKANMNILSKRRFCIFRRLEIFLYDKFQEIFHDEAIISIVNFVDVPQVHHEYYHLLKNTFGKMDKTVQRQIIDLIRTVCQTTFDEDRNQNNNEDANKRRDICILQKLEPIHDCLKEEDKEQYEGLVQKHGILPHPDFNSYAEISTEPQIGMLFFEKTIGEVFAIIKKPSIFYASSNENMMVASFEEFVRNNPMECSQKSSEIISLDSSIQNAFLSAIENSVSMKKEIDWNSILVLIEHYADRVPSNSPSNFMFDPMLKCCEIIKIGLEKYQIDYNLKDRIWNLVQKFITLSSVVNNENTSYPDGGSNSLTISINNTGGVSFHTLFRYVLWCHHSEKSKDVFTDAIKKILEDYINKKIGNHTISRHSAIGLHLSTMLFFDSKWTDDVILAKIASSRPTKIAFWDSFVSYTHDVHQNTLIHMYKWYDEFLNGPITKKMHEKGFYRSTIQYVTLGYLYDVEHFDKIFQKFVCNEDPASIKFCGQFISNILAENPDILKFKDKIILLWENQNFINHADLDMWFVHQPFDKKENIRLFLNYMQRHTGRFITWNFSIEELDGYIDDFPCDVVQCIKIFVDNSDPSHFPDMLKLMLKKLLDAKIPTVYDSCEHIINNLVTCGHNDYRDLIRN